MTSLGPDPTVSSTLIPIFKLYAEQQGLDFSVLAGEADLPAGCLGGEQARVPARCIASIWRRLMAAENRPHPGWRLGEMLTRHFPGGSVLFTLLLNCPTIGSALENFIRYHRIMADIVQPQMRQTEERVFLYWEVPSADVGGPDLAEALLYIYQAMLTQLCQNRLQPLEIRFSHPAPADLDAYQEVFGAPLRFGAKRDELVLKRDALSLEIHLANAALYAVLERHAARIAGDIGQNTHWQRRVMGLINERLLKGARLDIDAVAAACALSRRSLQMRLTGEGTTFRHCVETIRRRMAQAYLARPEVSMCDLAFLLGYSEQSAFNHAFKRWTGQTPIAYRNALQRAEKTTSDSTGR
ncbi:MAG: AraC family transcriptional regulator [Desulfosarcinaceae bacterium]|nr:AraC family transcriptional regulator [Desulfosarcinaceae bacterium]